MKLIYRYNVPVVFGSLKYFQDGRFLKRRLRIEEGIHSFKDVEHLLIDDGTLSGILFGSVCGAIYSMDGIKANNISFDVSLRKNEDGLFNLDFLTLYKEFYVTYYNGYSYRQWKETQKSPLFKPDDGLEEASAAIRDRHNYMRDFENQMQRRNVSVVFWNAITIAQCDGSRRMNSQRLKQYLDKSCFDDSYSSIRLDSASIYKRILIYLLYKRKISEFYCIMKYAYPVMRRFR